MSSSVIRQVVGMGLALFAAIASSPATSQSTSTPSYKSDIDIYTAEQTVFDPPNVLFILDNSANWGSTITGTSSTKFDEVTKSLANVVTKLQLNNNSLRVGLMMFTETGAPNSNDRGGYVRSSIRDFKVTSDGKTYQTLLGDLVSTLDRTGDQGNSARFGMAMAEAYRYFSLGAPIAGANKDKTDYGSASVRNLLTSTASSRAASQKIYDIQGGHSLLTRNGIDKYQPYGSAGCGGNYIVIISNGPADSGEDTDARALLASAMNRTPTQITGLSPNNAESNWTDEWAKFMKSSPERITTFTVDVVPGSNNTDLAWSALLRSAAVQSQGSYFKVTANNAGDQLTNAFQSIFNQIMAVDSAFASASLPVSVNSRGLYLNQVFIGMFRPDGNALPRWRGNLKQYQFGFTPDDRGGGTLQLVDSEGRPAIGNFGFINTEAVSFWSTANSFWANQPIGTSNPTSDAPDGEAVEKGGAAQRLRMSNYTTADRANRKVFTCTSGNCPTNGIITSTNNRFTTGNSLIDAASLGVTTSDERSALIEWIRGTNNGDEGGLVPSGATVRPSIHGDVLHSRPAVVNYGGTTGVVVFYGANDGMLRAVNGKQDMPGGGEELWAFIAPEHLKQFVRQRENKPDVRLSTTVVNSTTQSSMTPQPRDYFMDGPIGVYQKLDATGKPEQVIIYPTMRRGGRTIYAIDVTDPAAPKFLWKRSSTDTGLSVLGQTWSEPKIARLKGYADASGAKPVLIMGAGYDAAAEDPDTRGTTTMGNAILVLDAITGAEVVTNPTANRLKTDASVPADVTLIDSDADGYVDRAYAADMGGNIYRIDFESSAGSAPEQWTIYKFASLGTGGSGQMGTYRRKFFFAPDVILAPGYAIVQVGSGDREKPLDTKSGDAFFTLFDRNAAKGKPASVGTIVIGDTLVQAPYALTGTLPTIDGCYIPMNGAVGEKIVNAPTTVAGVTYFSSNTPARSVRTSTNLCAVDRLGEARVYSAPLACKASTSQLLDGGGLPPSIVSGVVLVTYKDKDGNTIQRPVPFIIGAPDDAAKKSALEGSRVKVPVPPIRKRKYWYQSNTR